MSIVGKYFKSPADYANLSKSSKKYNDITGYYHYNPVSANPDLFPNINTYNIYTENDIGLSKIQNQGSLSCCEIPTSIGSDYYNDYYKVFNQLINTLSDLANKYYIVRYHPYIYFNFILLKLPNNVIFEHVAFVPYGVDIKRFKTTIIGLSDKNLIDELQHNFDTSITSATIPEGITAVLNMIGYNKLTSIKLPSTLGLIRIHDECPNLHNLILPDRTDLNLCDINNSNINHISVGTKRRITVYKINVFKGDKPINITFRNAGKHNEDLSIVINNNSVLDHYIIENLNVILSVIKGKICANGHPILDL